MQAGELVLMDVGSECDGIAQTDIHAHRSVSGKFAPGSGNCTKSFSGPERRDRPR